MLLLLLRSLHIFTTENRKQCTLSINYVFVSDKSWNERIFCWLNHASASGYLSKVDVCEGIQMQHTISSERFNLFSDYISRVCFSKPEGPYGFHVDQACPASEPRGSGEWMKLKLNLVFPVSFAVSYVTSRGMNRVWPLLYSEESSSPLIFNSQFSAVRRGVLRPVHSLYFYTFQPTLIIMWWAFWGSWVGRENEAKK